MADTTMYWHSALTPQKNRNSTRNSNRFRSTDPLFINAIGAKYNDPAVVDYIDANGMGLWGGGNNPAFDNSQPNNNHNWAFSTIASLYRDV